MHDYQASHGVGFGLGFRVLGLGGFAASWVAVKTSVNLQDTNPISSKSYFI